jgi:hypothetical protein
MPINRVWRPFTDVAVDCVPEEAGVYELGSARTGGVVYIGSSETSVRSRLRSHRKMARFQRTTHFRFMRIEWPNSAENKEAQLCDSFKKKHKGKLPRLQERGPAKTTSISIFG